MNAIDDLLRDIEVRRSRLDFATRGVQVITHADSFSVRLAADIVFTDETLFRALGHLLVALEKAQTRDDVTKASEEHGAKRHAAYRAAKRAESKEASR